jgi:hypothetical protein
MSNNCGNCWQSKYGGCDGNLWGVCESYELEDVDVLIKQQENKASKNNKNIIYEKIKLSDGHIFSDESDEPAEDGYIFGVD